MSDSGGVYTAGPSRRSPLTKRDTNDPMVPLLSQPGFPLTDVEPLSLSTYL